MARYPKSMIFSGCPKAQRCETDTLAISAVLSERYCQDRHAAAYVTSLATFAGLTDQFRGLCDWNAFRGSIRFHSAHRCTGCFRILLTYRALDLGRVCCLVGRDDGHSAVRRERVSSTSSLARRSASAGRRKEQHSEEPPRELFCRSRISLNWRSTLFGSHRRITEQEQERKNNGDINGDDR
jgi:hypothetical protein